MTIISSIFSKLGNNSSLIRIATVDGIETAGRVAMAYKEGSKTSKKFGKLDATEKLVEANTTSLVWLGGLPISKLLFENAVVNKKYNFANLKEYGKNALARTDVRLLNQNSPQALKLENITDTALKPQVKKILDNPKKFKNLFIAKSAITTLGLISLVGYVLPKTIYKITHISVQNQKKKEILSAYKNQEIHQETLAGKNPTFATFMGKNKKNTIAFKGALDKTLEKVSKYFTQPDKNMIMIDGGIMAGRVGSTRNFIEAGERGLGELGYIFLLYCGGKHIANGIEKVVKAVSGIPTKLDVKLLQDNKFVNDLVETAKNSELKKQTMKFTENTEKGIINFIDNNLKENGGTFKNIALEAAQKLGIIDVVKGKRNPLKYIETAEVSSLNKNIKEFVEFLSNSTNPKALIKKAKNLKRASVIANIAISSTALAYGLPKLLFAYRKTFNETSVAPGLNKYYKQ